jgi:hypothetical protein
MLQRALGSARVPCLALALACGSGGADGPEPDSAGESGGSQLLAMSGSGGASQASGGTMVASSVGGSSAIGGSTAIGGGAGQASGAGGTGGTKGGAGNGGSGGSAGGGPPPVVGACDALGASGMWEKITPPTAKNTQGMVMDPFNIGTLWLGASPRGNAGSGQGGLFKSTDCGATWSHVNSGTNGTEIDKASLWSLAVDPVTPGVIYVIGQYGPQGLWKSTNGGVDWKQLLPAGGTVATAAPSGPSNPPMAAIGSVSMDPKDHLHLVLGMHGNCTGQYAPACGAETTDGGETWSLFRTTFLSGWAEQTGPYVIDSTTWIYTALFDGMWLTTDRGATWKNVSPPGVGGATGGEYTHRPIIQGSDGTYYLPSYNKGGLMSSVDGRSWTLLPGSPNGSYELGLAVGGGHVFMGDRNGLTYNMASDVNPTAWKALSKSPAAANQGAVFMEYDDAHHVLYSSNFEGGLWRMVTP